MTIDLVNWFFLKKLDQDQGLYIDRIGMVMYN